MNKPVPNQTEINRPFYRAALEERLRLQRCRSCETWIFFPRVACPHCLADELEWVDASGRGTLYSFALVYRHHHPSFTQVPSVLAAVALAEGPVMISEVVECDPAQVSIGMELEAVWEQRDRDIAVPLFRPIQSD